MNVQEKHTAIVDEQDIQILVARDRTIADVYKKYGAPPNWSRPPGFISLSKIILEQQVSLASAQAHFIKLDSYINAFVPENILQLSDEEMRKCQISRQKMKYLRCLSTAILEKELNLASFPTCTETEIRQKLTAIKGIGEWTTDIYLMFCLQAKDIFPPGDIAVVNTIRKLYQVSSREEIIAVAEKWKPNRSLGTYFMWHHYLEKRKNKS